MKKRTVKNIVLWSLVILCIVSVSISTWCVLDIQKHNQRVIDYNLKLIRSNSNLLDRQLDFEIVIKNQSCVIKTQADHILKITNEKKIIHERALDIRVENQELQKAVENLRKEVNYLMNQIQGYRQQLSPNYLKEI